MKTKLTSLLGAISSVAIMITALWFAGCSTTSSQSTATEAGKPAATAAQPATTAQPAPAAQAAQGGAELWGRNCGHCHNIRSPSSYSDAQWEVVMMHMRVRANLTAEEHKKILAFLKSAH